MSDHSDSVDLLSSLFTVAADANGSSSDATEAHDILVANDIKVSVLVCETRGTCMQLEFCRCWMIWERLHMTSCDCRSCASAWSKGAYAKFTHTG